MPKPQSSPSRLRFKDVPYAKRPIKQNPFTQRAKDPNSRESARETRRKLFLQQVAQKRDDRQFEERGDQLLRLDWRSERRRWEDQQARNAPAWSDQVDEEDIPIDSQGEPSIMMSPKSSRKAVLDDEDKPQSAEEEAERLRQHEEAEMEELLGLMDDSEQKSQTSSRYGSDDEYDGIFSDLVEDDGGGIRMEDDYIVVGTDVDMSG